MWWVSGRSGSYDRGGGRVIEGDSTVTGSLIDVEILRFLISVRSVPIRVWIQK